MDSDAGVKRLYKSRTDRMIDGVCAGVAEYIGVDATFVRLAFILLAFVGGIGIVLYILGMILMPAGSTPASQTGEPAKPARSSDSGARAVGIAFVVVGGILLMGNLGLSFWDHWWEFSWGAVAPLLLIAAGVALILRSARASTGDAAGGQGSAGGSPETAPGGTSGVLSDSRRLYRSRADRKILGVCGGLGTYLSVDSTILRLLVVISAVASFGGTLLLYFITAIIVPAEPLELRPA